MLFCFSEVVFIIPAFNSPCDIRANDVIHSSSDLFHSPNLIHSHIFYFVCHPNYIWHSLHWICLHCLIARFHPVSSCRFTAIPAKKVDDSIIHSVPGQFQQLGFTDYYPWSLISVRYLELSSVALITRDQRLCFVGLLGGCAIDGCCGGWKAQVR